MSRLQNSYRLIIVLAILIGHFNKMNSQIYFKQYIDSVDDCGEFNTQILNHNDSLYLINFITCDSPPHFTNILQYNLSGRLENSVSVEELVTNINSGYIDNSKIFINGVNNDEMPDSRLVLWSGTVELDSSDITNIEMFPSSSDVFLVPIGSLKVDSGKVIYGQYLKGPNPKVFGFLLWIDDLQSKDSLILIDTTYDWVIISDVALDSEDNLVVLIEGARIIDHLTYSQRIIQKYNKDKERVFEWRSSQFGDVPGIPSMTLIDSGKVVIEFLAEENGHIHSLIAVNKTGTVVWEHIFHIDDPKSLYRINDIITSKDGSILCCGTYRNVSQDIIETGYLCKLDKDGNLLWERIFYDNEELESPESGISKVMHFNSLAETSDLSIVVGGRVIHNFLSIDGQSDALLVVLDSEGCLYGNCPLFQELTRVVDFLSADKTWTEGYSNQFSWSFRYKFDTIPTVFDGNTYYELLRSGLQFSENWVSTGSWLRHEEGRIYEYGMGNNQIIYDFNLIEGDTFHMGDEIVPYDYLVVEVDTVPLLNGDLKKRWVLEPLNPFDSVENTVWIEGIGNIKGLLTNFRPWGFDWDISDILCVYWQNNLVYDNPNIDSCWIMTTAINELDKSQVNIFPNPAHDEITVFEEGNNIEEIKIFNIQGVLMHQGKESGISLDRFPSGYYYTYIKAKNSVIIYKKFIKI